MAVKYRGQGEPRLDDVDNPEWTEADFAKARPAREVLGDAFVTAWEKNRGGRPRKGDEKVAVSLRLDKPVVEAFKAGGAGWQTRMNDALRAMAFAAPEGPKAKGGFYEEMPARGGDRLKGVQFGPKRAGAGDRLKKSKS
jgi:uncharacterized protein (DUF4415 family)